MKAIIEKIKQLRTNKVNHYRGLWKHQKNRNKQLTKRINRLTKNISEDLKLDITNEEIRKLRLKVNALEKRIVKLNLEAQRYFDLLMDNLYKEEK